MSAYAAIAFTCAAYFGIFYYLLLFGDAENSFGMFALAAFFGIFLFLGLGGIELLCSLCPKKQE
jgi:hypothetical protein